MAAKVPYSPNKTPQQIRTSVAFLTILNPGEKLYTTRLLKPLLYLPLSLSLETKEEGRIQTGFGITLYRGFQVSQGTQGLVAHGVTTNQFYWGCAIELNRKLKFITNIMSG